MVGSFAGTVDFGPLIGGTSIPPSYGSLDAFLALAPTAWKVTVVKTGNGGSTLGMDSPAIRYIFFNISTQVVYTAGDWNRIASLCPIGTTGFS